MKWGEGGRGKGEGGRGKGGWGCRYVWLSLD